MNWQEIRHMVLERDNHKCRYMQRQCSQRLHIHHIIPISKGGTNDLSNLISLCGNHHRSSEPIIRKVKGYSSTSIIITKILRSKLRQLGSKGETYEQIILRLMKHYETVRK